jgi:hypothetical protein
MEDLLDWTPEQARDLDGKRKCGVVATYLDGIDCLAGDVQSLSELGL